MAFVIVSLYANKSSAQVLISILLGESLNTEKIEFGLEGGFNQSFLKDIPESKGLTNFNLGFYFHIKLKESNTYFSTGVLVKSNVGAKNINPYVIGEEHLDSLYLEDGSVTRKIGYFYVPVMIHRRFNQRFFLEGGVQLGLRNKAQDIFKADVLGNPLEYTIDIGDQYKRLDAGLIIGGAYKLKRKPKSMAIGLNYYYGLMNVLKEGDQELRNSSIYLYVKIPIRAGKQEEME